MQRWLKDLWFDLVAPTNATRVENFDYRGLRLLVGAIGFVLPLALVIRAVYFGETAYLHSISAYYHSEGQDIFVGSLCVIGVFLITYQGKGQLDAWLSTLAGFAALGIAFFPTADVNSNSVSHLNAQLHFVSAGVFFSLLAIFCLFLFPNAPRFMTFDQRDQYACRRDRVYRGCGYTIVVCLLLIGLVRLMPHWFASFKPVFILEWLALAAFGVSWIVAGKYWRFSYLVSPNEGYRIVK